MPTRKIPKNYRNVTGIAAHRKSKEIAAFESTLERDFFTLIEFSADVESFEAQPITIEWKDQDRNKRRYTPDVLVHFRSQSCQPSTLFEIKYRSDIFDNWKTLKPKFKQAIAYAKHHKWRFKIVTEVEIRTPLLETARFLLPFTRQGPGSNTYVEILSTKLKELHQTSPHELLQAIFQDEWSQAKLLPTLWHMVGKSQIGCDLSAPLNMNSKIWYLP